MNWDDLRIFLAVARTQRLEPAARSTGMDATTIGRRISRLEAALGTTLFEHTRLGHVLTEAGQSLLNHAEAFERAALAARGELTGEQSVLSGLVRVSVAEGFGTWIISRHLGDFHAAHPGITIDVVASSGFLNPSKREADLAVMLARPSRGPLLARRLTDYRLRLYAGREYLRRNGTPEKIEDLRAHTLVGYVPDLIYAPQLRYLEEIDPDLRPALRSSSLNAQAAMISSGAGVGVLPCFIGDDLPGVAPVLETSVAITRTFWLVVHRDARRLARVHAFVQWLDDLMAVKRPLMVGPPATDRAVQANELPKGE